MIESQILLDEHPARVTDRPVARGKFLFAGGQKFLIRGVTYGSFQPGPDGSEFPAPNVVDRDFAAIAASGMNTVRTYTVPPRWLLDCAAGHGLRVLIGIPWEQHITFLDSARHIKAIENAVRVGVQSCVGHPAVLAYTIGNEIPASIVRWHGQRRIERFLRRLYHITKAQDPDALVTYVNFPTTEYLDLSFLDFTCFNVYLESQHDLEAYLARLQNIAGDRPLVLAELGLDSQQHGEETQAQVLDWQVRTAFLAGCAGAFVFAWTDEWFRGGHPVEGWDFGLVRRDRSPKPALERVREAFAETPFPGGLAWPRISVVVCSYNGSRTIRDCFDALMQLRYPDFEVIVVNDGSTDSTPEIAAEYPFQVIHTENRGLSSARNTGMDAATGEIIAYTDDDACPDPDWLTYLAVAFMRTTHVGIGGPNIAPPGTGLIADCVANAPGGPIHVLLTDQVAEHIPGCNMAFRADALRAIGGFDPQFWTAGDDVDVCWRLQERGWTLGFAPAAMVWHYRRNSVRTYWRQQRGYGRAEALLERKWPEKYNSAGHVSWAGRLYGKGLTETLDSQRGKVFHGVWGSALFQSIYQPAAYSWWSLALMPEWWLLVAALVMLSALGVVWSPLLAALPLLAVAVAVPLTQATLSGAHATFTMPSLTGRQRFGLHVLTAFLHIMQPLARLNGRLRHGLTPWRRRGIRRGILPRVRTLGFWSERWRPTQEWLLQIKALLRSMGAIAQAGGDFDRWDLHVRGGTLGSARLLMAVEEHGAGRLTLRFRLWPRFSWFGLTTASVLLLLAAWAARDGAAVAALLLGAGGLFIAVRAVADAGASTAMLLDALAALQGRQSLSPLVTQQAPHDVERRSA